MLISKGNPRSLWVGIHKASSLHLPAWFTSGATPVRRYHIINHYYNRSVFVKPSLFSSEHIPLQGQQNKQTSLFAFLMRAWALCIRDFTKVPNVGLIWDWNNTSVFGNGTARQRLTRLSGTCSSSSQDFASQGWVHVDYGYGKTWVQHLHHDSVAGHKWFLHRGQRNVYQLDQCPLKKSSDRSGTPVVWSWSTDYPPCYFILSLPSSTTLRPSFQARKHIQQPENLCANIF